jgi:hypothetical protein
MVALRRARTSQQPKLWGVEDAAFHKRRGIEVKEMTSSDRIYEKLRAFRAGIEGVISFLKRTFGLERCTWRGFAEKSELSSIDYPRSLSRRDPLP